MRSLVLCSLGLLLGMAAGCSQGASDKLKTVPAKGVVVLDGAPLSSGTITFSPVDAAMGDKGTLRRPAQSAIAEDGTFELSTVAPGDGLLPGKYAVAVVAQDDNWFPNPRDPKPKAKSLIPEKYGSLTQSGLEMTIPESGATDLKIELTN